MSSRGEAGHSVNGSLAPPSGTYRCAELFQSTGILRERWFVAGVGDFQVATTGGFWVAAEGFLHPNRKSLIALLHIVLGIAPRPPLPDKPRPAFLCPCCGTPMQVIRRRIPASAVRRRNSALMAETAA